MKILHLDSSILGGNSVSRELSAATVEGLMIAHPNASVTYVDLAAAPISHLSGALFAAQAKAENERSEEETINVAASDKAMDDFLGADIIVIGAPMYNFGIPTQLKSWIDRVAVAGKTFRYTKKGPEGLAGGKKVIIVSSRGGLYEGTASEMADHQERYLTTVFGFLGITDVSFVRAEGVNLGPDNRTASISGARQQIPLAI